MTKMEAEFVIKAIVFDFDGLIIDTETPWYFAYKEVFKEYGVDLSMEVWGACVGTTFDAFNPFDYLAQESGQVVDQDAIVDKTRAIFKEIMKDQGLRPGVVNYLHKARELDLKIGLASSSNRKWIDSYLESHNLAHYFDSINTADDVEKVKPDPALYIRAMASLNVKGHETLTFEDSLNGLNAAKAAGAYCVIVPNSVTSFMNFEHEDLRISSMDEVELTDILARFNA